MELQIRNGGRDLTRILAPEAEVRVPDGVRCIRKLACMNEPGIRSLWLPDSVQRIEYHAFAGCYHLEFVRLPPGLKEIGKEAFSGCGALRECGLPFGLRAMGSWAFAGTALERVDMPAGLRTTARAEKEPPLQVEVFFQCEGLQRIVWPYGDGTLQYAAQVFRKSLHNPALRIQADREQSLEGVAVQIQDACLLDFAERYLEGTLPNDYPLRARVEDLRRKKDPCWKEVAVLALELALPPGRMEDVIAAAQAAGYTAVVARLLELQRRKLGHPESRELDRLYREVFS